MDTASPRLARGGDSRDPKELIDILGASGGTPLFQPVAAVAAEYVASFHEHPNNDYSEITRSK